MLVYCGRACMRGLAAVVLLCGLAAPVLAQTKLSGVIKDDKGRAGVNVSVVARNEKTGEHYETSSSDIGYYQFLKLPPGIYEVTVDLAPFESLVATVEVTSKIRAAHDFSFVVRAKDATEVTAAPVESTPTMLGPDGSLGATFSREMLESTPLMNGRTLQSFLALVPGIVTTDSVGTLAQFTAAGQRRFSNRFTIDGVSADLALPLLYDLAGGKTSTGALPAFSTLGGTQTLVPMEAIDEVQVFTTNASPGQARTPGAQTVVITRSGTNQFKGSAFNDVRPAGLAASDWFDNGLPRFAINAPQHHVGSWNLGLSGGGPLRARRLFAFATWERQVIDRPLTATISSPSLPIRDSASAITRSVLNSFQVPNGRELEDGLADLTSKFPASSRLSTLSLRLDANLASQHRAFARVNVGRSSGDSVNVFQQPSMSFMNLEAVSTDTTTAGLTSVYSSATHEIRMNVSGHHGSLVGKPTQDGHTSPLPLDLFIPGDTSNSWVRVNLFPGPGGFVISGQTVANSQHQVQLVDTWTVSTLHHEWRFGFDYRRLIAKTDPVPLRYIYRFAGVTDLEDNLLQVTTEYNTPARARTQTWAAFAQDAFRVSPRFSINYGVRYSVKPAPKSLTSIEPTLFDSESLSEPRELPKGEPAWKTSWTDFAPQVALTYQLGIEPGRETTARASWSLTFDELAMPGASMYGLGFPYSSSRLVIPSTFPVPAGELDVAAPSSFKTTYSAIGYAFDNLKAPRTHEWHVGIDRALSSTQRVSLAYAGAAGRNLVYWSADYVGDANHPVYVFSSDARSDYRALLAEYARRLSRGIQARATYTWSHAVDLDSGEPPGPNLPRSIASPTSNKGASDYDRRHILRLSASYRLPSPPSRSRLWAALENWQLDAVGFVISGAPISILTSRNFGVAAYIVRPDVVPDVPLWKDDATSPTGERINSDAFSTPIGPRQGTLERNSLTASTLRQMDLALSRSSRIGRATIQFRVDAFNVFNVPNFAPPLARLRVDGFGVPYQTYADGLGTGSLMQGGLVPIQQVGGGRSLQLGIRVNW